MKNKLKIERYFQIGAHASYFTLGYFFFLGKELPLYYYPALMLILTPFFFLAMRLANSLYPWQERELTLTPIIMAGTLLLNLEGVNFGSYVLAGLFGVLSRAFLKGRARHIFNPGLFGIFVLSMLMPSVGASALGLWKSDWHFILFIAAYGHFVVYKAGRLGVCYGYMLGFSAASVAAVLAARLGHLSFNSLEFAPLLFWPATLLSTTSQIYIFHVISDPQTSPKPLRDQLIFGGLIAVVDLTLRIYLIFPAEILSYMFVQAIYGLRFANGAKQEIMVEPRLATVQGGTI